jgi:peroxiredoxin
VFKRRWIMINVGNQAPDFILKDHNDQDFRLSSIEGKKIVLSFHPLAWTSVCSEQMKSLEVNYDRFQKLNTVPVGLSIDSVPSKKAWAKELGISKVRLLADFWPHGGVARLYDIFREKNGFSERANIIIDEKQRVTFARTYPLSQLPDIEEVMRALEY